MRSRFLIAAAIWVSSSSAFGGMIINPTFDDAGMAAAGLTATQIAKVHTAFNFAASQFMSSFNDPINVNITVTAVAGIGILGHSATNLMSFSYAALRAALIADAKTADDAAAVGAGGSVTATDPAGGEHNWWISSAQAKALSLIPDSMSTDGTFTFGAGYTYTFDPANRAVPGQYDFVGVAEHEISEIMGRIGLGGVTVGEDPGYTVYDDFGCTGAAEKGLTNAGGISFSIDNGATLLMPFNNAFVNGGDSADWASGTNDSFNAFNLTGVINDVSAVDLRVMDVIGYDRVFPTSARAFVP
jgi:hypothetical protein